MAWGKHYVALGDGMVTIGCHRPYPGWSSFKQAIQEVCPLLSNVADKVERYSLKYVDMLPVKNPAESVQKFEVGLTVGGIALSDQRYQLRLEIPTGNLINVIQIIGEATAVNERGEQTSGAVLDIDTVCNVGEELPYSQFLEGLPKMAEDVHTANKQLFFSCLKKSTIDELGPEYE